MRLNGGENLILYGIINNFITKLDFSDYRILLLFLLITIYNTIPYYMKSKIYFKIKDFFIKTPTEIKFVYNENTRLCEDNISDNIEALIDYITINSTLTVSREIQVYRPWGTVDGKSDSALFRPDGGVRFLIDKEKEIYGQMSYDVREEGNKLDRGIHYKHLVNMHILSYKLTNQELIEWVTNITEEYIQKRNSNISRKQLIIDVSWDSEMERISIETSLYKSSTTFDKFYLPGQEKILEMLDQFLTNKEYNIQKGIKDSFNIMCSGSPGTGKTSLMKSIANMTKRHLVNVKINDSFPAEEIAKVLRGKFGRNRVLDTNDIIFIFEEMDILHRIVKKRDYEEKEKLEKEKKGKYVQEGDNHIGTILTALDGIAETPGRMIIMSTNHLEVIDPAIYRKGRVDYHYDAEKYSKLDFYKACLAFWKKDFIFKLEDLHPEVEGKWNASEIHYLFRSANHDINNISHKFLKLKHS